LGKCWEWVSLSKQVKDKFKDNYNIDLDTGLEWFELSYDKIKFNDEQIDKIIDNWDVDSVISLLNNKNIDLNKWFEKIMEVFKKEKFKY